MIDQDVVDCLDKALSLRKRAARVDSASMAGGVKDLVIQFERRAGLIVSRINAHLPAHQKCPVYIFFCEAEGYGAFALRDRYDYVVLNLGLAPTLTEFFLRMMATPGLWPSVGEQKAGPAARAEPATEYFPAHLLWKSLPSRMPDDPLRRAFAVIFMSECLDFIVRHEFAHLVLGHVVAGGQTAAKSDPIVTQALELAADGHAAIWGLDPLQQMPSMLGRSPGFVDDANRLFHRTPDDAMVNYLLVISFVFRLMDEPTWNNHTLVGREHPPGPMRFQVVCLHIVEHFQRAGNKDGENRVTRAMQEIWEIGEILFAKTLDRKPNPDIKRLTMSEETERHYNQISDRAANLPKHLFGLAHNL